MRSESSSEPPSDSLPETPLENGGVVRKTRHLSRKRTLKRGCFIEPLQEKHFKYLWAAYKLGDLAALDPEDDLDPLRFKSQLIQMVSGVLAAGGECFLLSAGGKPAGFAIVTIFQGRAMKRQLKPHVLWFRQATKRNRLECWLKFVVDLKQEGNLVIEAAEPNWRFFDHLCKYGAIRALGKFRGCFEDGSDAMIYQGVN